MNIHVFFGDATFHARSMIENLKKIDEEASFYIVCKNKHELKSVGTESLSSAIPLLTKSFLFRLIRFYYVNDNVFIHGLNLPIFIFNYLLTCVFFKKNVSWICWGSGLNEHIGIKGRLYSFFKKTIYSSFEKINTLMSPDFDSIKKLAITNDVKLSVIPYIDDYCSISKSEIPFKIDEDGIQIKSFFSKKGFFVLVGNQSSKHHNHKELLLKLSLITDVEIFPVLLMSYPSSNFEYTCEVETLLNEKFKGNYLLLKNIVPRFLYDYILANVNVVIIDTEHQTGLAAIYSGISNSAIIVLRENSKNSRWLNYLNIKHLYTAHIDNDFWERIKSISQYQLNKNIYQLNSEINQNALICKWEKFIKNNND